MLPTLSIGPLSLRLPELLILIGLWVGFEQTRRLAPRFSVDPDALTKMLGIALAAGVIGGRLAYVLTHLGAFAERPLGVLTLSLDLFDLSGGLLLAGIAALIAGRRLSLDLWPSLDALTPGLAVLAVAIGLSHIASGDAFGSPTALPWAIELWGAHRHPTQFYETLLAWLVALLAWPRKRDLVERWFNSAPGSHFWLFAAGSALANLVVEGFRADSPLILDTLRQGQVLAWLVLAAALWQLRARFMAETVRR
jgi:phosphatidylglycerol---prolipoprotein diacylglyceryl transferase